MPENDFEDLSPAFNVAEVVTSLRKGHQILKDRIGVQRQLILSAQYRDNEGLIKPETMASLSRIEDVLAAQSALQEALLAASATLLGAMAQELGLQAIRDADDQGFTREAFAEARVLSSDPDTNHEALDEKFPELSRALYAQDLAEMSLQFVSDLQFDPSEIQMVLAEAWDSLPEESDTMIEGDRPEADLAFRVH